MATTENSVEYVGFDYAGFNGDRPRITLYPSGATLLKQPYMNLETWKQKVSDFLADVPAATTLKDLNGSAPWPVIGTVADLLKPGVWSQ